MAKKTPQKSLAQLESERSSRFDASIAKIKAGQTRKQAILASGMDPRTFNKRIASQEDSGKLFLTPIDKKGHYRISGTSTVYARWEVFRSDGVVTTEHVDYETSLVISRYWNTVRTALSGNKQALEHFSPKYVYNIYGEKIELERDYTTIERWHSRIVDTRQATMFNETIYERTTVSA